MHLVAANPNNSNKSLILKNCPSFTDSIEKTNNTQADIAKDINAVMSLDNLIENSNNYSKTF